MTSCKLRSLTFKTFLTSLLIGATALASAQGLRTLLFFNGAGGANPEYMTLAQGTDGNFYGTTSGGGTHLSAGTVFRINPAGNLTKLYNFCAQPGCSDGRTPFGGLVLATDGNFYGTTGGGGANNLGTVFRITPSGSLTTLYRFDSTHGAEPMGTLLQASDGALYGTAHIGGANNSGTVFRITLSGKLTTIYSFCVQANCADGSFPQAGLTQGADGVFYGTTTGSDELNGTAFKITAKGNLTTLHTFCSILNDTCPDGSDPTGSLVRGGDGAFYGTTQLGGPSAFGTIFRITPTGVLTTLHTLQQTDGEHPIAGLTLGNDGNFYGTTNLGGSESSGTLFEMTPSGTFTTLYSLSDGSNPFGGLLQATDGNFYGTTFSGGDKAGDGTVFTMNVGLDQFVITLPGTGRVGDKIRILGTDLTGSTRVTFNGTPARFVVASASEIDAQIPLGATTGRVVVTTNALKLLSNLPFRVR
jgi:uncharacterized repeat protein (TIGR03803 family)